jgi:hypothetical protein
LHSYMHHNNDICRVLPMRTLELRNQMFTRAMFGARAATNALLGP